MCVASAATMRVRCCMFARDPRKYKLSHKLLTAIENAFKAMDDDNSREIDVCEALGFFKNFGKVNAKVLFEEMDEDKDGKITIDEWIFYFKRVACTGLYSEDDIIEEVDSIVQGESFMHFRIAKRKDEEVYVSKKDWPWLQYAQSA